MEMPAQFDLASPITQLSDFLGAFAPDWSMREEPDTILYREEDFSSELSLEIPYELIENLKLCYKQALTMKFLLEGAVLFDVSNEITYEVYEQFHLDIRSSNSPTLIFEFRINKQVLINIYYPELTQTFHLFLYIFPNALERLLTKSSLSQIEYLFWNKRPDSRIIILVPRQPIFLLGSYLTIIGDKYIKEIGNVISHVQSQPRENYDLFDSCQNMVKWQDHYVNFLTPYHLNVSILSDDSDLITQSFLVHLVNLILLYIADRSFSQNKRLISIFNGVQQSVELKQSLPGELSFIGIGKQAKTLFDLFEWAYDPNWKVSDRLPFVQIGFVQSLSSSEPDYKYRLMLENIGSIFNALRWHWKAFLEGKVEEYVHQVQDLEQVVSETVRSFTDQISLLNKNLLETMLAAVGVVIASFIAFLFSDQFNPVIFQISIWVYCTYMFIFPMLISVNQQNEQLNTYEENFEIRRERFEERLYKEKVQSIIGDQIIKNKARYIKAVYYTRLTYILVIVTLFISSIFLPALIQRSVVAPVTTRTPVVNTAVSTPTLQKTMTFSPSPISTSSITSTILPSETPRATPTILSTQKP